MKDIESLAQIIGGVNIIFLAVNFVMVLQIKLAISEMKTEIEKNRREDVTQMRTWVENLLRSHCEGCASYSPMGNRRISRHGE